MCAKSLYRYSRYFWYDVGRMCRSFLMLFPFFVGCGLQLLAAKLLNGDKQAILQLLESPALPRLLQIGGLILLAVSILWLCSCFVAKVRVSGGVTHHIHADGKSS